MSVNLAYSKCSVLASGMQSTTVLSAVVVLASVLNCIGVKFPNNTKLTNTTSM